MSILSLPGELRNNIYRLILSHQDPISFSNYTYWLHDNRRKQHTPGIFRANKAIHHEASTFFYAENCFDFTTCNAEAGASFLKRIDRNAIHIQHIYLNFPKFQYLDPGDITLEDHSARLLANIQRSCANLRTVRTSLQSTTAMEYRLDKLDHLRVATEALKMVDTKFKAMPSLPEIIVEVYEDGPSDYIRRKMTEYGWTMRTTVEEEDDA